MRRDESLQTRLCLPTQFHLDEKSAFRGSEFGRGSLCRDATVSIDFQPTIQPTALTVLRASEFFMRKTLSLDSWLCGYAVAPWKLRVVSSGLGARPPSRSVTGIRDDIL